MTEEGVRLLLNRAAGKPRYWTPDCPPDGRVATDRLTPEQRRHVEGGCRHCDNVRRAAARLAEEQEPPQRNEAAGVQELLTWLLDPLVAAAGALATPAGAGGLRTALAYRRDWDGGGPPVYQSGAEAVTIAGRRMESDQSVGLAWGEGGSLRVVHRTDGRLTLVARDADTLLAPGARLVFLDCLGDPVGDAVVLADGRCELTVRKLSERAAAGTVAAVLLPPGA